MSQKIVPLKIGEFGEQGTGKTTTAALIAAALSKQYHSSAPVWVTDPELGWQFPRRRIFEPEGIQLVQRTVPTFKAMREDLRAAERAGAAVYCVELAKPWMDLLKTVHANCGDRWGNEMARLWGEWVNEFLNSPLHCIAMARVSDITEDVLNENGDVRRLKVGEGMKAGGQRNNFGYEPHFVLRLTLERKQRKKLGKVLEDEGRMVHRCDVLKDRTWELNGAVFRWPDRAGYKPGDFKYVWQSVEPHFREMQATAYQPKLDTDATSDDLVEGGQSYWSKQQKEKRALLEEWDSTLNMIAGGQTNEAKSMRLVIGEALTGVRSRTRFEDFTVEEIQHSVLAIMRLEERIIHGGERPSDEAMLRELCRQCLEEMQEKEQQEGFDPGRGVEQFLKKPPAKTAMEVLLEESVNQARAKRQAAGQD